MFRRWVKWTMGLFSLALVGTCVFFVVGGDGWLQFSSIRLPHERDQRLVGTWKGNWRLFNDPDLDTRVTKFHADGTGEYLDGDQYKMRFSWGTEDNVLYTRRMAVDYWSGKSYKYMFLENNKTVQFYGVKMFDLVCNAMRRQ